MVGVVRKEIVGVVGILEEVVDGIEGIVGYLVVGPLCCNSDIRVWHRGYIGYPRGEEEIGSVEVGSCNWVGVFV